MTTNTHIASFIEGLAGIVVGLAFIAGGVAALVAFVSSAVYLGDGSYGSTLAYSVAAFAACTAIVWRGTRF